MSSATVAGTRLGLGTLDAIPARCRPPLDPRGVGVGIVHLGLGAFHRAHQAAFTQDAMLAAGGDWGICGVTQRSGAVRDALAPQDGLYALAVRGEAIDQLQVVASLREVLWAQPDAAALLARLAAPSTAIVTLTVTEKAYRHDPQTNRLRGDDAALGADLAQGATRTVIAQLVQGLARRRASDAPITIVCCDNLPANGRVLRGLVLEFAARLPGQRGLEDWIAQRARFPCTMVDRIVPATTDADRARAGAELGVQDRGLVVAEPFRQWVIEDDFAGPRPAWERAGATLTGEVGSYEQIKLRMLNGSHSTLAYLGALAGHEHIAPAAAVPAFEAVITRLMADEVAPTVAVPAGLDLAAYQGEVRRRFANPALPYRTSQVAGDGSQKLPQRLLDTVRERRRAGAEPTFALLGVAAWMRYVSARRTDSGRPLTLDDPLAGAIARRLGGRETPAHVVDTLLGLGEVFADELAADALVRERLTELVAALARDGAVATAQALTR